MRQNAYRLFYSVNRKSIYLCVLTHLLRKGCWIHPKAKTEDLSESGNFGMIVGAVINRPPGLVQAIYPSVILPAAECYYGLRRSFIEACGFSVILFALKLTEGQ